MGETVNEKIVGMLHIAFERIKLNPLAVKVKLNDLRDNLDIKRMPEVLESDLNRLNKYLRAYNELIKL